jgi:hypothetical protein
MVFLVVRQALRGFGSFTVEDRQALTVCKWKFFWIVAAFTIWYEETVITITGYSPLYACLKNINKCGPSVWQPFSVGTIKHAGFTAIYINCKSFKYPKG